MGLLQFGNQGLALLHPGHPAAQAVLGQHRQCAMVVDVERGSGHERAAVLAAQLHRRQVVGLDPETAVADLAVEYAQFGLGLDQGQGRQHHLLAAGGQLGGQLQPLHRAQLAALAAHRLAQVDDVQRPVDGLAIEGQGLFARPEVLQRPETEFHACLLNARSGGRGRAWSGGLRRGATVRPAIPAVAATAPGCLPAGRSPVARCGSPS